MSTRKTVKKKTAAKKDEPQKAVVLRTEDVSVDDLRVYHKNPRVGNVNKIAKSLHLNGQYKPIVVNVGTHTGRKNEILAGNHTYLGARKELTWQQSGTTFSKPAYDTILASFVDVDDTAAAQIVLADNKTADDGTYDENVLADLISGIPDINVDATGYSDEEWEGYLDALDDELGDDDDASVDLDALADEYEDESRPKKKKFNEVSLGDEDEEDTEDDVKLTIREKEKAREDGINLDTVSSNIAGALQLSNDPIFDDYILSKNGNEYPRLIPEMLMTLDDLPEDRSLIQTWAGSATKDDDNEDRVWFYNYGVDSTSGMLDVTMKNMIVSFFTWDDYFEGWWNTPAKYTAKVLNTKVKHICTPDFTPQDEMGNIFLKWQLYRSRYLGRYFQEAGLKLLPHCIWPDGDENFLVEETLATMPDHVPLLLIQMQTLDPLEVSGGMDHFKKQYQIILDALKPEGVVLYTGKPGRKAFADLKYDGEVIDLTHRQDILSAKMKPRKKKKTL